MGTWGTGIFSDDLASDLRDDYRDLIAGGVSPADATQRLIAEYKPDHDPDDGPVFWLALAATQWRLGHLDESVKQRALQIIDNGDNLRRWEAEATIADVRKRRDVLNQLWQRLMSPPPSPKRPRPRYVQTTDFEIGDIVRYQMKSERSCLLRVVGQHQDKGGRMPVVEVLDWAEDALPSEEEMVSLAARPRSVAFPGSVYRSRYNMLARRSKTDYPAGRLETLARKLAVEPVPRSAGVGIIWWKELDHVLQEQFGLE